MRRQTMITLLVLCMIAGVVVAPTAIAHAHDDLPDELRCLPSVTEPDTCIQAIMGAVCSVHDIPIACDLF